MSDYHLSYSKTEDRLFLTLDENTPGVALTRRLTREMLKAMAQVVAQQKSAVIGQNRQVRDAVLDFERSKAVTEAYADGSARREQRKSPNPMSLKLAIEVDIVGKQSGSVGLVFRDGGTLLNFSLDARGIYVLMSSLIEITAAAGWDFPEIASWLEPVPGHAPEQQPPKQVH